MKRLLLLFSAWMFLLSCTRDADENSVLSPQVPEPVSPYAVSESEALQSLAVVLQQIDGEPVESIPGNDWRITIEK